VIEALVGAEHHSATRQAFFHSSLVSFLVDDFDILKTMRALDHTIRAFGLVAGEFLPKDRSFAIITIGNLKLTYLKHTKNGQGVTSTRQIEREKQTLI
jgi:hypothetical protein